MPLKDLTAIDLGEYLLPAVNERFGKDPRLPFLFGV